MELRQQITLQIAQNTQSGLIRLTDHQLRSLHQRINRKIEVTDEGCWKWLDSVDQEMPRLNVGNSTYRPHKILWEIYKPDEKLTHRLIHGCELQTRCVNPFHKQARTAEPRVMSDNRRRIRFAQHGKNCVGLDFATIERIVSAGTVDVIPKTDTICDCERAWILQNTSITAGALRLSGSKAEKLRHMQI